ncbi:ABC transporter permease [Nitrospirillum viridazoti]|uniref:ABC transporter permease n=2 Tax=Nitrospirillum TaxID=1543705 RepID=A0A248JLM2_9PROT|nr:ABC transporter permease subunit [Nitrospirillum amazonense]ASG19559.1 ABC transporter permease [Nitrospirillum amazonense CBAmc]EGY00237.1 histidine transport system permease protein [Nitrospirillum amazonense Y2]TWB26621.1 octopine/nopaline transport system permease protein [Nitrospirillum amazonense]TWB51040.1 octopine/nopaline transport system permease protein [Nitrospirillum amazonense]
MIDLLGFGARGWGLQLLQGMGMTLLVAVSAYLWGLGLGGAAAALKLSGHRGGRVAADAYTTIVRGVPSLLVIYLLFFGGNSAATWVVSLLGFNGPVELSALPVGILAVGTVSGAYSAEVLRGGALAVPHGQVEAAKALGMNRWLTFRRVMLPQTLRYALPGLGNVWQLTLKDTSLVSVVALVELMRVAYLAQGATRQPFLFFTTAGLLYLAMAGLSGRLFARAELWAGRGVRRAAR